MTCPYCKQNMSFKAKECKNCGAPNELRPKDYVLIASKLKEHSLTRYWGGVIEYVGDVAPVIMTPEGVEYL